MEGEAWEEEGSEVPAAKDEMCVEIGRILNVGCVECDDMPEGIIDDDSEDEGDILDLQGQ